MYMVSERNKRMILAEHDSVDSARRTDLEDLLNTIETVTGLEVCIYSSLEERSSFLAGKRELLYSYQRHMSDFCRIVKGNKSGRGCGGHDSRAMVELSAEKREPFVNVCHAGIAEVIIPVFGLDRKHIATVFVGQVLTENQVEQGFSEVLRRTEALGVNEEALEKAFSQLPVMSYQKLLKIGEWADMALKGLVQFIGIRDFEQQFSIAQVPAIRKALQAINAGSDLQELTEDAVARKVNLNPAYFSRLFHKVMKCRFTDFMTRKRLELASRLLHHTDLSIAEITSRCGYSRQSYFSRLFKKHTGMTPSCFRKGR